MAARPSKSTLAIRLGIIVAGVGLGGGLRLLSPPEGDVTFDHDRSGGARPAAIEPSDANPDAPDATD